MLVPLKKEILKPSMNHLMQLLSLLQEVRWLLLQKFMVVCATASYLCIQGEGGGARMALAGRPHVHSCEAIIESIEDAMRKTINSHFDMTQTIFSRCRNLSSFREATLFGETFSTMFRLRFNMMILMIDEVDLLKFAQSKLASA